MEPPVPYSITLTPTLLQIGHTCMMPFFSWKVLVAKSCLTLCDPMDLAHQAPLSMNSPGKNTEVGSHFLLQWIFLVANYF